MNKPFGQTIANRCRGVEGVGVVLAVGRMPVALSPLSMDNCTDVTISDRGPLNTPMP